MCGICGVVYRDPERRPDAELLRRMCAMLAHRGPDGEGIEILGPAGLGHRRLAILDIEGGRQPMFNEDRSVAIVFNGAIYNFRALRKDLEDRRHAFATDHSDTETIVHSYEENGPDCVEALRGMFAFAVWDARERRLTLARDRAGKKPLYYAETPEAFYFASEMKALLVCPEIERRLSHRAIYDYLTHQYVPAPQAIFETIRKLPHAHTLVWQDGVARVRRYWQPEYEPKFHIGIGEAADQADALIDEAVRLRLESDVPLGCFLSGGIDSSITVAMMRRHVTGALRTFSIGFEEEGHNELPFARAVAERYETQHEEFIVRADAAAALPKLVWHLDEPFADMAALPTYYLSEMARRHVTVALNGDGGDESFAGYERYRGLRLFRRWAQIPDWARRWAARPMIGAINALARDSVFWGNVRYVNDTTLAEPAWRYIQHLIIFREDMKERMCAPEFAERVGRDSSLEWMIGHFNRRGLTADIDRKMNCDVMTYLPGDLLPKVDRTTMAFGLEGRSPLLDQDVMQFAASLPGDVKCPGGALKTVLKEVARPLLPAALIARAKQGFSTPVGAWAKSGMKDLTRELILSPRALGRGLFRRAFLEALLKEHESGQRNHQHRLWSLMCLEMWFRTFVDPPRVDPPRMDTVGRG